MLLRESYREGGKVRNRTLANLSSWPAEQIEALKRVLQGEPLVAPEEVCEVVRSLPHGHGAAVLGMVHQRGVDKLMAPRRRRERDLVVAMLVARLLDPGSQLALARTLSRQTQTSTLGACLEVEEADAVALYAALDWLGERQAAIEDQLAQRHLKDGSLVLYDLTATYMEGRCCPLAKLGDARDGKRGTLQIVCGLLCDYDGRPIAVEVCEGKRVDPKTLASQLAKVRERCGLSRVVGVGDRGRLTAARLREELQPLAGLDWITALRAAAIRPLAEARPLSLFDARELAEITLPDFPGERLIACRNPTLAAERSRKREELLRATARDRDAVVAATRRDQRKLQGKDRIGLRVGTVLNRCKVGQHFDLAMLDEGFSYQRNTEYRRQEAALDGRSVIRTSVPEAVMNPEETVAASQSLAVVEPACRTLKRTALKVRPIYHRLEHRVRAHIFLCMLAYDVEWHLRQARAPLLFDADEPLSAQAARRSIVSPAQRSAKATAKASRPCTEEGQPVHRFCTLLADWATLVQNQVIAKTTGLAFTQLTRPTPRQQKALDLVGASLRM